MFETIDLDVLGEVVGAMRGFFGDGKSGLDVGTEKGRDLMFVCISPN